MSQTTKPAGSQGQSSGGPRGKRAPVYGRGPPGGVKGDRPRRPRREPVEEVWVPKTALGKKVASGEITSLEEIIESGSRIQESGIIKKLLPDLTSEVVRCRNYSKNDFKWAIYQIQSNGCSWKSKWLLGYWSEENQNR